ncbi:mitochondrial protein C2orf69 homolog isoform X1 [Nerophis ophidion]|uniref:mitochondrial protein C2orf69 homolog isoform X1 n=1 Tax=Nerophis ophidion TaxID=159077 RepID=UPI002AE08439|nr:mitochondrial protein C2orf69 homolog isoform X1 [Nerophis ophidion]
MASTPRLHASSSCPTGRMIHKLLAVCGTTTHMKNDLLLLKPEGPQVNKHLVFFHGDIQNFQDEMVLQPEGVQWLSWSLEQVAMMLGARFPQDHIWVIRASRMYLHKFSSYHNFVESNLFGAPQHAPYSHNAGALRHLRALLSHAMARAGLPNGFHPQGDTASIPAGFSLTVVGFSKGCVVLNQMLCELGGARADRQMRDFVQSISNMFWLDGGHPGGSETWVTDKQVLRQLANSGIGIHVHVTPYEVRDPMRAWVGREHRSFIETLEEFGASPFHKIHFEDEPPSLENHFRVIQDF